MYIISFIAVLIHDWDPRERYHVILEVYDIVEHQKSFQNPNGGGLVVLRAKVPASSMVKYPWWWW